MQPARGSSRRSPSRPEYYLTRTERGILAAHADAMIAQAAEGARLRIAELGAGSADKTRLLLKAAVARQGTVVYEPLDVSASALDAAQRANRARDCRRHCGSAGDGLHARQRAWTLKPAEAGERRLVLYIGSSIGNFEPPEACGCCGASGPG